MTAKPLSYPGTNWHQVLQISIGQRYSVMVKLNQPPGDYLLRFASYPWGDMQQVIEGMAIVSYKVGIVPLLLL